MLHATTRAPMYSRNELANRLKSLRLNSQCSAQVMHHTQRVPIAALADFIGIDRKTVYSAMAPDAPLSMELQRRLSFVVQRIESGELKFERHGQRWQSVFAKPQEQQPRRLLHVELGANGPRLKMTFEPADNSKKDFVKAFGSICGSLAGRTE